MVTLHIEHPIGDLNTWLQAFTRFEDARRKAGVRAQRVRQPVDDEVRMQFAQLAGDGEVAASVAEADRRGKIERALLADGSRCNLPRRCCEACCATG